VILGRLFRTSSLDALLGATRMNPINPSRSPLKANAWRYARLALLGLMAGAERVAMAAVQPEAGIGLPRDVSADGHRIDWLIHVTGLFVAILFVIMVVWMVLAAVRFGPSHQAEYDHGSSRHHVITALAISSVIFFVVDGNLFVNAIGDLSSAFWNFEGAEANPAVVKIEINAHQWAWDARYAGPDGKFNTDDDVVTLNDIRVPIDTPVVLQLASVDVIHSFYLPNFRIKTDAVPGMINRMLFEAKQTGEFDIACAQHCGTNHYKMKGQLTVLSKADYETWLRQTSGENKRGYDPDDKDAHWGWEWKRF
jgi:cytochrome c oxidase subunit 2